MTNPSVNIARLIYLLVCQAAGVAIASSTKGTPLEISTTMGLLCGLGVGIVFIGIERLMEGFTLRGFSTATFGLGVGLFCAWLLTRVEISSLLELSFRDIDGAVLQSFRLAVDVALFASLGFLGTVLALRGNRDDFAFIIPYVRFRQDSSSGQPIVMDAYTIMDGRVLGLQTSGFVSGKFIIPQFVLEELQTLAVEGGEGLKKRAERGLENLRKMQESSEAQVAIHEAKTSSTSASIEAKLIETAKFFGARLLTTDESLTKIAKLQGVSVLNLNELDLSLRPIVEVGEILRVPLVRPGKDDHQAVGYLSDGTMIVVNHAAEEIGTTAEVVVTSKLQTASGVMVFSDLRSK